LLEQFNVILETRDTARGLIVNMSDVLFDFNKYTLRLEVDGYTDSVGSEDYNLKLSDQRAEGVRNYLVGQGIVPDDIVSKGFGKDNPVASNDNAAGRQKNRRVEMVVSGDIIGTPIGTAKQAQ
jgi:outer membrane protein OmpA-like peptidoglycan-associated protein